MNKNERQYNATKASLEGFQTRLTWLRENPELREHIDPIIAKAEEASLESTIEELREELREYDLIKQGHFDPHLLQSVGKIAEVLIKARIARGWSQRDLAQQLGVKEQQIQRYEANDYAEANLTRVQAIARILVTIPKE